MAPATRSSPTGEAPSFAARLVAWHRRHGRHALPWQRDATRYRVWVSEVMLQQTRADTVAGYFERFVARFPDETSLAAADLDEVLHLWSGLGYYARARNLHRAARIACERHHGTLPSTPEALIALPGIGRSTAGAILALAHGARHPILDGNVKRVLARHHRVAGWPGSAPVERQLWTLAERHTPHRQVAAYTQAIMDLGATVCTRARPRCDDCPLADDCAAHRAGCVDQYPTPRPRRALPLRRAQVLVARDPAGALLLERRPPNGVWGGLWSFPEFAETSPATDWCQQRFGLDPIAAARPLASFEHTFTHFRLHLEPWLVDVADNAPVGRISEPSGLRWHHAARHPRIGLAAPVARIEQALAADQ